MTLTRFTFLLSVATLANFITIHTIMSWGNDSNALTEDALVISSLQAFLGLEDENQPLHPPYGRGADDQNNDGDQSASHETGAFANCDVQIVTTGTPHPDQRNITLSCHTFPYRVPSVDFAEEIVIGVLSGAGGIGPERRMSIRDTWAYEHSVFFIVAGPWKDIELEYEKYGDLIWLDQEEVYDGENSVLTFKTMTFMKVVSDLASNGAFDIKYAFKTDDDSFVNVKYLYKYLLHTKREKEVDYWGHCTDVHFKPTRDPENKWSVSYEMYPEEFFPKYCQGAGFALSRKFLECAAESNNQQMAEMRFMPFEDTAVGLLAERCGVEPSISDGNLIRHFRTNLKEEHERVKLSRPKISKKKLTIPNMEKTIVQHRIYDNWDMKQHNLQTVNPSRFKKTTQFKWYKPKHHEIYRWQEDTKSNPNAKKPAKKNPRL